MKKSYFRNFIDKTAAVGVLAGILGLLLGMVLIMLLSVPILLKWVGIQYDGIGSLIEFSLALIFIEWCMEGVSESILKRILPSGKLCKWQKLIKFALDCVILAVIVFVLDFVMEAVELSDGGILFFAVLLTLWCLIINEILDNIDDEDNTSAL